MTTHESWLERSLFRTLFHASQINGLQGIEWEPRKPCEPDEHCFCIMVSGDSPPEPQCCQCGQKRRKQGVT